MHHLTKRLSTKEAKRQAMSDMAKAGLKVKYLRLEKEIRTLMVEYPELKTIVKF